MQPYAWCLRLIYKHQHMKFLRLYFIAFILFCEGCILHKGQVTGRLIKTFDLASNSSLVFEPAAHESYYYEIVSKNYTGDNFEVSLKENNFKISSADTLRIGPFLIQDVKFYYKSSSTVQFTIFVELNKQHFEFPKHRISNLN